MYKEVKMDLIRAQVYLRGARDRLSALHTEDSIWVKTLDLFIGDIQKVIEDLRSPKIAFEEGDLVRLVRYEGDAGLALSLGQIGVVRGTWTHDGMIAVEWVEPLKNGNGHSLSGLGRNKQAGWNVSSSCLEHA